MNKKGNEQESNILLSTNNQDPHQADSQSLILKWSTFLGSSGEEIAYDIEVDPMTHDVVITGITKSETFPTLNAFNATHSGNDDVFLSKFSSNGNLIWSTFLGGTGYETGYGVAINPNNGDIIVVGVTGSTDFPTLNAYSELHSGSGNDLFISKFNASGSMIWSTFFGGNGDDVGKDIEVDPFDGAIVITGYTYSTNFPIKDAFDSTVGGGSTYDAFVSKFNSNGSLNWSTYLGDDNHPSANYDQGHGITIDPSNRNVIVVGYTTSTTFPTQNAFDLTHNGGGDAFVTKFLANGTLVWSTFIGGSDYEYGYGIAVDSNTGAIFITGATLSTTFPVQMASFPTHSGGSYDAFVCKFNADGFINWSTFLGGNSADYGYAIGIDPVTGGISVVGRTSSTSFPILYPYSATNLGSDETFISHFESNGSLNWSTYIGGTSTDGGWGIDIDPIHSTVFIVGSTNSADFPTQNAYNATYSGGGDVFITDFLISNNNQIPAISHPADINIQEGTLGVNITWTITDDTVNSTNYYYNIWRNGFIIQSGSWIWIGGSIYEFNCNLDGLPQGTYEFIIDAYDGIGLNATDAVYVNVQSLNFPPVVTHPDDKNFQEGTFGNNITWYISDSMVNMSNAFYIIYVNGIINQTGGWVLYGPDYYQFVFLLDSLTAGFYDLYFEAYDGIGYNVSDNVYVNVTLAGDVPSINHPTDLTIISGSSGNNVTWTLIDSTVGSSYYMVWQNGSYYASGTWQFVSGNTYNIIINIDTILEGIYYYYIEATDGFGNNASDTVMVTVLYNEYPQIITGGNYITMHSGVTGRNFNWTIYDSTISSTNLYITRDGSPVYSNSWVSAVFYSYSLDGLAVGNYTYNLTVMDGCGRQNSTNFYVEVIEYTGMIINGPDSISYSNGTTGNLLNWTIIDPSVGTTYYEILVNGSVILSGSWTSGVEISVNIDGLSPGLYEIMLNATDGLGEYAYHFVNVSVYLTANENPNLIPPSEMIFYHGSTGHILYWTIYDSNYGMTTASFYIDGTFQYSIGWSNGSLLSFNVDGLPIGFHNITLIVYDGLGGEAMSVVGVTVLENIGNYLPNPPFLHPINPNPDSDGNINLYWDLSIGATEYWVYMGTNPNSSSYVLILTTSDLTYTITGLASGTYYFAIKAVNSTGQSEFSIIRSVQVIIDGSLTEEDQSDGGASDNIQNPFFQVIPAYPIEILGLFATISIFSLIKIKRFRRYS